MDKLLEVLREKKYDKKPNVDTLKAIDGLGDVNATQRDEAWAVYQKELDEAAASNAEPESNSVPSDESDSEKDTTTTTSTTEQHKVEEPAKVTHRVTVKRDGFRRLGRAWMGSTEVALTDDEHSILDADPMFVVVEL